MCHSRPVALHTPTSQKSSIFIQFRFRQRFQNSSCISKICPTQSKAKDKVQQQSTILSFQSLFGIITCISQFFKKQQQAKDVFSKSKAVLLCDITRPRAKLREHEGIPRSLGEPKASLKQLSSLHQQLRGPGSTKTDSASNLPGANSHATDPVAGSPEPRAEPGNHWCVASRDQGASGALLQGAAP